MNHYYFTKDIDDFTTLCLAPITNRLAEMSGECPADLSGYFLFQRSRATELLDVKIIAQIHSDEGALELSQMLQMR